MEAVAGLMITSEENLSSQEKRFKRENVLKLIRNKTLEMARKLKQQPSPSLLCAIMDVLDFFEGENELRSVKDSDLAGVKQLLLTEGNYTCSYIPNSELKTNGKKTIPIVTHFADSSNFTYYDKKRSMVGTYAVGLIGTESGNSKVYFLQQALHVPNYNSMNLLKTIIGDKYELWDMSLEIPTHMKSLTPTFCQIQACQLMKAGDQDQADSVALASHMETIQPMCCTLGGLTIKKKRTGSVDWLDASQVNCSLTSFTHADNDKLGVYFDEADEDEAAKFRMGKKPT